MKQKFTEKRALDVGLCVLAGVNLAGILLAGEDPRFREALWTVAPVFRFSSAYPDWWNKVIYDASLGSIISLFFYGLVVRLPEHQKRARIKRSFKAQYAAFKEDCIQIFLLVADGSYTSGFPETLLDQKAFRDYFKASAGNGQTHWDRVANNLEGHYLQLLLNRMESFREEIVFVLNSLDIEADAPFEFAKNLSKTITSASILTPGYDNGTLLRFLWTVFSGWSFVTGYPESDVIEDMIREL